MKKILSVLLALTTCVCLTACGSSSSSGEKTKQNVQSSTESREKDINQVEYSGLTFYESSKCNIELKSIELGYMSQKNRPFDALILSVLAENKDSNKMNYDGTAIYINGYKMPIYFSSLDFYLDGNAKEVGKVTIYKEDLDKAGIKQIESIKLKDDIIEWGSGHDKIEELKNGEVKINPPYELKWE